MKISLHSLRAAARERSTSRETLFAALVRRWREWRDPNDGVQVRARVTYAIGRSTIAMGDVARSAACVRSR